MGVLNKVRGKIKVSLEADINAAARGTKDQDPFSINFADGVGQGAEPEISPTAPDDALNLPADELPLLNDTDNSTGPTEENLINTVLETIASTDCGDHEFRGDYHSDPQATNAVNDNEVEQAWMTSQDVQQTLESNALEIDYLLSLHRKIKAVGISTRDIFAIEHRYPTLLVSVGNGFTLESCVSNNEYALEAISEKIGKLILAAGQAANRLIDWIIERLKKLDKWYGDSKLRQMIIYLKGISSKKETLLSPREIYKTIPEEYFKKYFESRVQVGAFNQLFKSNLSLEMLDNLSSPTSLDGIVKMLSGLQGEGPAMAFNMSAIYDHVFGLSNDFNTISELIQQAAKLTTSNSVEVQDVQVEAYTPAPPVKLTEIGVVLDPDTENDLRKMNTKLVVARRYVSGFKTSLSDLDRSMASVTDPAILDKYRIVQRSIKDELVRLQIKISDGVVNTTAFSRAAETIITLHDCLKSTNVSKLAEKYKAEHGN